MQAKHLLFSSGLLTRLASSTLSPVFNASFQTEDNNDSNFSSLSTAQSPENIETNSIFLNIVIAVEYFCVEYRKFFGYFSLIWSAIGVFDNVMMIIVLTDRKMRSTTNLLMTAIAATNLLIMGLYFPFAAYFYIIKDGEFTSTYFGICLAYMFVSLLLWAHMVSNWLTVVVAGFRYGLINALVSFNFGL